MSENELIEFKDRSNFDFLRFRYAQDYEQRELKADCERVAQYARDTVKDLCLLGLRLKEMKAAEQWREVVDETGTPFSYAGFEEFCKYAFGFSQTKVSNLVRIAEFVQVKGDKPERQGIQQHLREDHCRGVRYRSDRIDFRSDYPLDPICVQRQRGETTKMMTFFKIIKAAAFVAIVYFVIYAMRTCSQIF